MIMNEDEKEPESEGVEGVEKIVEPQESAEDSIEVGEAEGSEEVEESEFDEEEEEVEFDLEAQVEEFRRQL